MGGEIKSGMAHRAKESARKSARMVKRALKYLLSPRAVVHALFLVVGAGILLVMIPVILRTKNGTVDPRVSLVVSFGTSLWLVGAIEILTKVAEVLKDEHISGAFRTVLRQRSTQRLWNGGGLYSG